MTQSVYCSKRTDNFKLHEVVEKVNWDKGKIEYYCMWCDKKL